MQTSEINITIPLEYYNQIMNENTKIKKAIEERKLILNTSYEQDVPNWEVVNESEVVKRLNEEIEANQNKWRELWGKYCALKPKWDATAVERFIFYFNKAMKSSMNED